MTPRITQLENGARVVTLHMPQALSASVGVWADVGARHEPARWNGISHFLEHMLFKGTARRSARRISEEIEGVGGDINAHTSEERTCYYATAPGKYFRRVCDVLIDLYAHPRLAEKDIELERGVIAEEILMYRDEPGQHVHDLLNTIFWPRHSLGRPVTGTVESILPLCREDFLSYRATHYHAGSTLLSAAGAVDHDELVALAAQSLGKLPGGKRPRRVRAPELVPAPEVIYERRETGQTHVSMGLPGPHNYSRDRYAAALLQVLLGGNASSRLFQDLREKRGWCYSVATCHQPYADTGMINISIGLDGRNLEKCLRIILEHFRKLTDQPCRASELRRAKEYIIGSSLLALERTGAQNNRIAHSLLVHGRVLDPAEWQAKLLEVTPEQIREVAAKYLDPLYARLAVIGPSSAPDRLQQLLLSG